MTHKSKITTATSPLFCNSYRKIKTGLSLFGPLCIVVDVHSKTLW